METSFAAQARILSTRWAHDLSPKWASHASELKFPLCCVMASSEQIREIVKVMRMFIARQSSYASVSVIFTAAPVVAVR